MEGKQVTYRREPFPFCTSLHISFVCTCVCLFLDIYIYICCLKNIYIYVGKFCHYH